MSHRFVKYLRQFRTLHRLVGIFLALFMIITAVTGLLLGWKKDAAILQPVTHQGLSPELSEWKSLEALSSAAIRAMDSAGVRGNTIDRMDVRPDKGMVKVLFRRGYWEVQVDGKTGRVLSVARRHADWIEHLHDGSLVSDTFKLGYTNMLGIGLVTLALSGLWLWYGPKVIRKSKQR